MNSIKAFLKAKGLYLVCLALVFAATITGIAAIRSVVRGVEDLTRIQKQALEEGADVWDSPDAAVNQPAQDVPVATAQPSPAPSAAGSASSSLQQGAGQSGSASGGTGSSAASSAQQGTLPHAGWNGKVSQAFSGNTLVYNPTLGDWRTHNGTDYTAEQVTAVAAGTVTAIADDALWGRVVEVTDAQDRVWRYCGLEEVAVTQREKVTAGTRLGTTGNVPAEAQQGTTCTWNAAKPAPAWTRKRINTGNAAAPWMVRRHCSAMNSDKLLKISCLPANPVDKYTKHVYSYGKDILQCLIL